MVNELLTALGVSQDQYTGGDMPVHTPIDGSEIARVRSKDVVKLLTSMQRGFE